MRKTKVVLALILAVILMCTIVPFTSAEVTNYGISPGVATAYSDGGLYLPIPQDDIRFASNADEIQRRLPNYITITATKPDSGQINIGNLGFDTVDFVTASCIVSNAYGPMVRRTISHEDILPLEIRSESIFLPSWVSATVYDVRVQDGGVAKLYPEGITFYASDM